jgi:uncharacterized protein YciI
MKLITALLFLIVVFHNKTFAQATNKEYDSVLAKKLHADQYGMKKYVLVMLKPGTAKPSNDSQRDSVFRGHMANIKRLASEGKLILAGPFGENSPYEGMFIFNTESIEEAKSWTSTDPAVKGKYFEPEYLSWYGSAAIQEIMNIHQKIQKTSF